MISIPPRPPKCPVRLSDVAAYFDTSLQTIAQKHRAGQKQLHLNKGVSSLKLTMDPGSITIQEMRIDASVTLIQSSAGLLLRHISKFPDSILAAVNNRPLAEIVEAGCVPEDVNILAVAFRNMQSEGSAIEVSWPMIPITHPSA